MHPLDPITSEHPFEPSIRLRIANDSPEDGEDEAMLSVTLEPSYETDHPGDVPKGLVNIELGMDACSFGVSHLPLEELERLGLFLVGISRRWRPDPEQN